MKLSARNVIRGTITEIDLGAVNAVIKVDIGATTLTSVITVAAVEELGLRIGSRVHAIIKSSSVMLAVD
jgi:molybdopterin-binding protein